MRSSEEVRPVVDDFEALALEAAPSPGTRCTVCVWLERLAETHPGHVDGVLRAIRNPDVSAQGIVNAIGLAHLPTLPVRDPGQAVKRHRAQGHVA